MPQPSSLNDCTVFAASDTNGLGQVEIQHPAGTFAITPASRIALEAICQNQHRLSGLGLDWGCGAGGMAIFAARIPAVQNVIGLDILAENILIAQVNGQQNSVSGKVTFIQADSYSPASPADAQQLRKLAGRLDFIVANPPASDGDDGFGFRRVVLAGARDFLKPSGIVFLNISWQYGAARIAKLTQELPEFQHQGVIASSDWVPFDAQRPDLRQNMEDYAAEEERGGLEYSFRLPGNHSETVVNARVALRHFHSTGESPLSRWQTHLFCFQR